MISSSVSNTETVRNVYIIDPNGIIKLILIYPLNVGRFIPEILRAIQALQISETDNAVIPANWVPCNPIIMRPPQTMEALLERAEALRKSKDGFSWYLRFFNAKNCENRF